MNSTTEVEKDLDVLFPERRLTAGGQELVVRELSFAEQIQHYAALRTIAQSFSRITPEQLVSDESLDLVLDLLRGNWPETATLVALSCGQPVEWVEALSAEDGEALLLTWWGANQDFFLRRRLRQALMQSRQLAGAVSMPV